MLSSVLPAFQSVLPVYGSPSGNLAAVWHFDETMGSTAYDQSGNGNDGTLMKGAQFTANGKFKRALGLDATSNQFVQVPQSSTLEPVHVTVEAWIKSTNVGNQYIVSKGDNACQAASYGLYSLGGLINFGVYTGAVLGQSDPALASSVMDGNWHYLAGTFDGSTVRLYLDGVEVGDGTPFGGSIGYNLPTTNDFFIGTYSAGTPACTGTPLSFTGNIDEVRVWARALSAAEVLASAQAGLRGLWHFDETVSTATFGDGSGYGNVGVGVNGATTDSSGKFGNKLRLDGMDDFVQVADDSTLEPQQITVEAWVQATSPGPLKYMIAKGASDCFAASYAIYTDAGGLRFYVSSGGVYVPSPDAGPGLWDGNWHHVAGTFDGSMVRLYVDGTEVPGATPVAPGFAIGYGLPTTDDLFIGTFEDGGTCPSIPFEFPGDMDEVRVWARALTSDEIGLLGGTNGRTLLLPNEISQELGSAVFTSAFRAGLLNEVTALISMVPDVSSLDITGIASTSSTPKNSGGGLIGTPTISTDGNVMLVSVGRTVLNSSPSKTVHLRISLTDFTTIGVNVHFGATIMTSLGTWRPYGPHTDRLVINFYPDAAAEFDAFEAGLLDLTDAPIPTSRLEGYLATPDFVISKDLTFVALDGWDGLIYQTPSPGNIGLGNFWTTYNLRQRLDYIPADSVYTPGGGIPDLQRWGFSQPINTLNVFQVTSLAEQRLLREIYEPLLVRNPVDASQTIDWLSSRHEMILDTRRDVTTLRFTLQPNLFWSDGEPLTSDDVVFSILNYRDVPAPAFYPFVKDVIRARSRVSVLQFTFQDVTIKIKFDIVEVVLRGASTAHEFNIGRVPIIPKHIWDADGDRRADSDKTSATFDPMASGALIGSGPLLCYKDPAARIVGGPCSSTGTQTLGPGDSIVLHRNEGHQRDALLVSKKFNNPFGYPDAPGSHITIGSLHAFNWADVNDDFTVNILDLVPFGANYGSPHPYLDDRVYGTTTGTVDTGELNVVASYFFATLCGIYGPRCNGLDPGDPYKVGGVFTKSIVVDATGPGTVNVVFDMFNSGSAAIFTEIEVTGPFNGLGSSTIAATSNDLINIPGTNPPGDNFVKFKVRAGGEEDIYRTPFHI